MQISMKIKLRKTFSAALSSGLSSGFSMVEMLISIAIITVLLGVVVFSYRSSSDKLALDAAAQEVAIAIRQAQVYGLSVREDAPSGGNFNYGYGVYFNPVSSPSDYYLFIDRNNSNVYESASSPTEQVERFTLRNGVQITSICKGSGVCYSSGSATFNVKFIRPTPIARLTITDNLNQVTYEPISASVKLTSPLGLQKSVIVYKAGGVEVQ